jgi:hypothetical protein
MLHKQGKGCGLESDIHTQSDDQPTSPYPCLSWNPTGKSRNTATLEPFRRAESSKWQLRWVWTLWPSRHEPFDVPPTDLLITNIISSLQEPEPGHATLTKRTSPVHMGRSDRGEDTNVECLQQEKTQLPGFHHEGRSYTYVTNWDKRIVHWGLNELTTGNILWTFCEISEKKCPRKIQSLMGQPFAHPLL